MAARRLRTDLLEAMPLVVLRSWRSEDEPEIASMLEDEHIRRWSSMDHDLRGWIGRQRAGVRGPSRAICLPADDRALGKIALRMPGHASPATSGEAIVPGDAPVGELSYWLVPTARGRGLAGAAVEEMMELVALTTDLRSVVLDIEVTNTASMRLARRLGAQHREPDRFATDRLGVPRRMAVFVLAVRS